MFSALGVAALLSFAPSLPSLDERSHSVGAGLCDPNVKQLSGYFKLNQKPERNYFYWFFESRNDPTTDPVVLWMTGGPGCSSEVALFGENGPCTVGPQGDDTHLNPHSWNSRANLLYIDQPSGTGFSYPVSGTDVGEAGVARDMYDFLQHFFQAHPQYAKLPFFAFGESYAGHYIPAVTHAIWQHNLALPPHAVHINLVGTSVGNGLTNPSIQYAHYAEMAISTNHHKPAVSNLTHGLMVAATAPCIAAIEACKASRAACLVATDACNLGLLIPYTLTGMNPYDMRIKCAKPPLCYDFSNVATYLAKPEVQATLGVTGHKWADCDHAVALGFELDGDWMQSYQQMLPDQLKAGIRVLMYAGDQDYICNWLGNQAWTRAMAWEHKVDFNAAPVTKWSASAGGAAAGEKRSAHGFTFLRVYEAGHMVPRDQPAVALAMLNAFLDDTLAGA